MDIFLPKGFKPERAGRQKNSVSSSRRISVEMDGKRYPVLRHWTTGFVVTAQDSPAFAGVVSLYEDLTHVQQCLITGREEAGTEVIFTVKRAVTVEYAAVAQFDKAPQQGA